MIQRPQPALHHVVPTLVGVCRKVLCLTQTLLQLSPRSWGCADQEPPQALATNLVVPMLVGVCRRLHRKAV